jgi:deoxyribose-phosphate aldolase
MQGASLKAAAIMLGAIQSFGDLSRGFKASGGVRSYQQAKEYYLLAQIMMGETWPNAATFRLGASSLLNDLEQR